MKRQYETPIAYVEQFMANEYVAACWNLYCAIPGDPYKCKDSNSPRWAIHGAYGKDGNPGDVQITTAMEKYGDWIYPLDRLLHGSCNEVSYYNGNVQSESNKAAPISGVKIEGKSISANNLSDGFSSGKQYNAAWHSSYAGKLYSHYGVAELDSKSNHS